MQHDGLHAHRLHQRGLADVLHWERVQRSVPVIDGDGDFLHERDRLGELQLGGQQHASPGVPGRTAKALMEASRRAAKLATASPSPISAARRCWRSSAASWLSPQPARPGMELRSKHGGSRGSTVIRVDSCLLAASFGLVVACGSKQAPAVASSNEAGDGVGGASSETGGSTDYTQFEGGGAGFSVDIEDSAQVVPTSATLNCAGDCIDDHPRPTGKRLFRRKK